MGYVRSVVAVVDPERVFEITINCIRNQSRDLRALRALRALCSNICDEGVAMASTNIDLSKKNNECLQSCTAIAKSAPYCDVAMAVGNPNSSVTSEQRCR